MDHLEGALASEEIRPQEKHSILYDCEDLSDTFTAEDGGNIKSVNCQKNPGHENFIPIIDFKLDHLPEEHRSEEKLKIIFLWAELTVKVKVKYVSKDRPETYRGSKAPFPNYKFRGSRRKVSYGSGYVFSATIDEDMDHLDRAECRCLLCDNAEKLVDLKCWYFTVITSIHVVYDSTEAERSIFELFYDADETRSKTAKYLYGVKMYQQVERDREKMSYVICVTHDEELAEKLQSLIKDRTEMIRNSYLSSGPAVLISHPHGCSKTVTTGSVLHLTIPVGKEYPVEEPISFEEGTECIIPYSSLSDDLMQGFTHAYGIDPQDSSNVNVVTPSNLIGEPNLDVSSLSIRTDILSLDTLDNCRPQTPDSASCAAPTSATPSDCQGQITDDLDLEQLQQTKDETVADEDSSPKCIPDPNILKAKPTNASNSPNGAGTDLETSNLSQNDASTDFDRADDKNGNEGTKSLVVYCVDECPDGESVVSIPDPDHIISLALPPNTTFILPKGAEYARRYTGMKSLFHFPPGTKFQFSDGKEVCFPPDAQFYSNCTSIQIGYMSYNVDSCPSSSGGCMLLDGGNGFLHTFPHAGSVDGGVSVCGLRCYPILPSAV